MGSDEGEIAWENVSDSLLEKAERGGDWYCILGREVVGRGTHLDSFVETMAKDYLGQNFSIGRVGLNEEVEIVVVYGGGVGDYWNRFDFLRKE